MKVNTHPSSVPLVRLGSGVYRLLSCTVTREKSLLAPNLMSISDPRRDSFLALLPLGSPSTTAGKTMSTPLQGTSDLTKPTRSRPAFGQPVVCGNHMVLNMALTSPQQIPHEQPASHQLRRLIVRQSNNIFSLGLINILGGTSNQWKGYNHSPWRYDLFPCEADT